MLVVKLSSGQCLRVLPCKHIRGTEPAAPPAASACCHPLVDEVEDELGSSSKVPTSCNAQPSTPKDVAATVSMLVAQMRFALCTEFMYFS